MDQVKFKNSQTIFLSVVFCRCFSIIFFEFYFDDNGIFYYWTMPNIAHALKKFPHPSQWIIFHVEKFLSLTPTRGPSFFDSDSIFVQFFWIPPPHPLCHTDVKHFLLKMLLLQGESVGVFPPRWAHPYSSTEKLWLALEKRLKK